MSSWEHLGCILLWHVLDGCSPETQIVYEAEVEDGAVVESSDASDESDESIVWRRGQQRWQNKKGDVREEQLLEQLFFYSSKLFLGAWIFGVSSAVDSPAS
jgi:hypothetical protein